MLKTMCHDVRLFGSDTSSTSLPPAQAFPALRRLIQQNMLKSDPNVRRVALLSLQEAVKGVSEFTGSHVEPPLRLPSKLVCMIPMPVCDVPQLLQSDAYASGWRMNRCSILLPALLNLVADPSTQRQACTALDSLMRVLGNSIKDYLELLMVTFSRLVGPVRMKSAVVGAIGRASRRISNLQSSALPHSCSSPTKARRLSFGVSRWTP